MEHVPEESSSDSEAKMFDIAARIFGNRLPLAQRYWSTLSSEGIERGLLGPREIPRLWSRHILNCAVLGELISEGARVVDIGSGAGLPGIPLAIARPDLHVFLVEPLLRRSAFLSEFISATGVDITVVRGRAEESGVISEVGGADVVTSRAVAPLGKVAGWSMPLLEPHGVMLAVKGARAVEELARDRNALRRVGALNTQVLHCGVELLRQPTTVVRAERNTRPAGTLSKKSIGGPARKSRTHPNRE